MGCEPGRGGLKNIKAIVREGICSFGKGFEQENHPTV